MTCIIEIRDAALKLQAGFGRPMFADEIADYLGCEVSRIITLVRMAAIEVEGLVHPANQPVALAA